MRSIFIDAMLYAPGLVSGAAAATLAAFLYALAGERRRRLMASLVVLAPVAPLLALRLLLLGGVALIDRIERWLPGSPARASAALWIEETYG